MYFSDRREASEYVSGGAYFEVGVRVWEDEPVLMCFQGCLHLRPFSPPFRRGFFPTDEVVSL